ncbi:16S rRNA (cytidine(1402)-2'-O)-methyltransferase [Desulfurobacterium atlanticum]|uniref:Ribosomal RNA small subunit methyltransferase I n=1 Tax=Desulfurobacterium atlanticum TaxID=240169 RepID=A0A238ZYF0_9BACT|nr:16S rRNA (cytidine(1402)-2'-O)-methyltransferase [Desulfurobacterium atlanticum]SNR88417.1 16S rRNA (cytidine1402-2'-O)-methyltransferase [Desulfurobacterium atlanticum]
MCGNSLKGTLYVVATPIGNLKDITLRAIEILKNSDIIAAEDTRRTRELLSALGIKGKRLISCHEHNEKEITEKILNYLREGLSVSLVSDAGTPTISDPGYKVVRAVREEGFNVTPIPGASAVIAALSASGFPTDRFLFYGFLPKKRKKRQETLKEILYMPWTVAVYESPHRIEETLKEIATLMPEKRLGIYREITKLYEEFLEGTAGELIEKVKPKGEFVLLFYPFKEENKEENIEELILSFKKEGLSLKEAVKKTCQITGRKRNEIYQKALEIYKK